jgi:hypothetical protein
VVKRGSHLLDQCESGCEPWISQPFAIRHSRETICATEKYSEVSKSQSPELTWPADVTKNDADTWDVCHMIMS